MAGETVDGKQTIAEIFETMEYGAVYESYSSAKEYFQEHQNVFNAFVDDKIEKNCQFKVFNPCNREELGLVRTCSNDAIPKIMKAAENSPWLTLSGVERAKHLRRVAKEIEKKRRLLAEVEAISTGRLFHSVNDVDVPALVKSFNCAANANELRDNSIWEPMGVVLVTAESINPFFTHPWQLADILAAGNCIVMVILPENLISCLLIAEICQVPGLPSGLLNVLSSTCINVNAWIKDLPSTQKVVQYFPTRSLRVPSTMTLVVIPKRNPTVIVFDTVDLHSAADGTIATMRLNVSAIRLLVQESVYFKFLPILKEKFLKLRVGSSMDKSADLTPVFTDELSLSQWQEMLIESEKKGAEIIKLETQGIASCHHFPVLVENIQTSSPIVQKQALPGPAILVLPFRTAKEAVAVANSWAPGGEAFLWTERSAVALEVASLLKVGSVWINGVNIASDTRYLHQGGFYTGSWYDYVKPRKQVNVNSNALRRPAGVSLADYDVMYYGGKCQKSVQTSLLKVLPSNSVNIAEAGANDVASALAAACSALLGWGGRSSHSRSKFLHDIAEEMESRRVNLVNLLNQHVDASTTAEEEFERSVQVLNHWAALCEEKPRIGKDEERGGIMTVRHEPVGIIGIICPCKDVLLAFVTLMAASISQGNCIIIVPSEELPLPVIGMFQIFDRIGLPAGVVNVLIGSRTSQLSEKLLKQSDIQAFWYSNRQHNVLVKPWKNSLCVEDFPWQGPSRETDPVLLAAATRAKSIWMPVGDIFAN